MGNKRGVSVFLAIFCLLLFSSLAFVVCSLISTHTKTATDFLAEQQALHIAEAGAQYSIWYLCDQDPYWTTAETDEKSLGGGTYTLQVYNEIEGEEEKKVIISRSYFPQRNNYRAMREVKLKGTFGVEAGAHPIYNYAIYTDSTVVDSGIPLDFDVNKYNLTTVDGPEVGAAGYANVHSNNNITFRNGSGWVVDGYVYSCGTISTVNWTGNPWRRGMTDHLSTDTPPPYLDDIARDYYKYEWNNGAGATVYYPGDKTFTGLVELGSTTSPALIFVEGKVKIGNVVYYRPNSPTLYGVGTIVSGGGDLTITGPIIPASGSRTRLALVSFYDTKYQYELSEPPYSQGGTTRPRILNIQDSSGTDTLVFDNENITITYQNDSDSRSRYGFLTVVKYDGTVYLNEVLMDRTPTNPYTFSYTFNTSDLGGSDWYYFRIRVNRYDPPSSSWWRRQIYGYFIVDNPAPPQHSIRTFSDSAFTKETSGFNSGGTVYLQLYAANPAVTTINTLQVSDYALTTYNRTPTYLSSVPNYIRCRFTLPSLTTGYWYNLYVATSNPTTYFYKQLYIKPTGIYTCSHANNYFVLNEQASLSFIGNLTAKHGFKINQTSPISSIAVTYDTSRFRSNSYDENALPGSVTFKYTWKEN